MNKHSVFPLLSLVMDICPSKILYAYFVRGRNLGSVFAVIGMPWDFLSCQKWLI
jgi:hypothetical protein